MPASLPRKDPACVGLAVWNLFTLLYRGPTHCLLEAQPTEWQRIGNQVDAVMILARGLTEEDAGDRATAKLQDRNYKPGGPLLNDASFERRRSSKGKQKNDLVKSC